MLTFTCIPPQLLLQKQWHLQTSLFECLRWTQVDERCWWRLWNGNHLNKLESMFWLSVPHSRGLKTSIAIDLPLSDMNPLILNLYPERCFKQTPLLLECLSSSLQSKLFAAVKKDTDYRRSRDFDFHFNRSQWIGWLGCLVWAMYDRNGDRLFLLVRCYH